MFLYVMLYIVLAYLMLLTALFNAVCLQTAYLFSAIFLVNAFCFHAFVFGLLTHSMFISFVILHHI